MCSNRSSPRTARYAHLRDSGRYFWLSLGQFARRGDASEENRIGGLCRRAKTNDRLPPPGDERWNADITMLWRLTVRVLRQRGRKAVVRHAERIDFNRSREHR